MRRRRCQNQTKDNLVRHEMRLEPSSASQMMSLLRCIPRPIPQSWPLASPPRAAEYQGSSDHRSGNEWTVGRRCSWINSAHVISFG